MRVPALHDVDLTVAAGELLLLCGPSGGGKSTLLRVLQGIVPQLTGGELAGEVEVAGCDATRTRPHELADRGVTLVYQNALEGFVADRVEDEVAFGPESLGVPAAEIDARVRDALADVGLAGEGRRTLSSLSGGEQQRVAIAAALSLRPRLLLLDEPTAHLDEVTAARIVALLDRVRRTRGIALVLAEHRLGLVAPLADRVAVIALGEVRAVGSPRATLATAGLAESGVPVPRALTAAVKLGIESAPLTANELARAIADRGMRAAAAPPTADERPPREGAPALAFHGVSYRYPGAARDALHEVTLEVRRGERVALVGPSGAGKSTLARLALGLLRPTAGDVTVLGIRAPATSTIASRVGLVVQNPMRQLLAETVEGEVALGLRQLPAPDRARRVAETLERFGLAELRDRHPLSLSEGERRRLALAATIAPAPDLLVLDEPTLAQDESQRRALAALVRAESDRGVAILAITHDREFANDACDRVVVIDGGEVASDLPLAGDPAGIDALRRHFVPLADVPAAVLLLAHARIAVHARSIDELVEALA